jgi:hypothetical protein
MDEDIRLLADPDLLAECARVGSAVEVLAERYRALGEEFSRRAAARWAG